ncbi:helix-turn-helix domain-containing protein [uncultured Marivirga sp.]|uniref:helix-turn-helix domain-containing protein n=1 Tax=uncultured Marivirga sp. TaxID=1123707 RepID=UPI0030EBB588|tara:strand:+ start:8275 stop:8574 length:300 start_codon:yes stop_codon:yes gene_type:complete
MKKQILISMSVEEFQAVINQVLQEALASLKPSEEPKKNNNYQLLIRNEAAEFLKITLVTLSDWSKRNIIQAHYLGGRVYYVREELSKALNIKMGSKYTT